MHSSGTERAEPNDPVRSVQVKFCLQTFQKSAGSGQPKCNQTVTCNWSCSETGAKAPVPKR